MTQEKRTDMERLVDGVHRISGVVTSTMLTLLVLHVFYSLLAGMNAESRS